MSLLNIGVFLLGLRFVLYLSNKILDYNKQSTNTGQRFQWWNLFMSPMIAKIKYKLNVEINKIPKNNSISFQKIPNILYSQKIKYSHR